MPNQLRILKTSLKQQQPYCCQNKGFNENYRHQGILRLLDSDSILQSQLIHKSSQLRKNNYLLVLDNATIYQTISFKQDLILNQDHLFLLPYLFKVNIIELFGQCKAKISQKTLRADLACYKPFIPIIDCQFIIQMYGKCFVQRKIYGARNDKYEKQFHNIDLLAFGYLNQMIAQITQFPNLTKYYTAKFIAQPCNKNSSIDKLASQLASSNSSQLNQKKQHQNRINKLKKIFFLFFTIHIHLDI